MPKPPPDVAPEIVRRDLTETQLQAFLVGGPVAVDTETLGLNTVRDRLCLVQLCNASGKAALVQIPRDQVTSGGPPAQRAPRLKRLLEDPSLLKVFHFARFDLAALRHNLGILVEPIYCTRTVSKLVRTYTDRHGLKDLALELLDVEMDKAARHTDWSSPELTPEQVRYAISDVTMLNALMVRLDDMLAREERTPLAWQAFKAIPVFAQLDIFGYVDLFEH